MSTGHSLAEPPRSGPGHARAHAPPSFVLRASRADRMGLHRAGLASIPTTDRIGPLPSNGHSDSDFCRPAAMNRRTQSGSGLLGQVDW